MKNTIIKILAFAAVISGVVSCNDALDLTPDGRTSFEDIFKDDTRTGAYLNSCYQYVKDHGVKYHFFSRGPAVWSDEAWDADDTYVGDGAAILLYNGVASAGSHPILNAAAGGSNRFNTDHWNSYWTGIRKCTFFLKHIGEANVRDARDKSRWEAEARLLRAYYYSELLRWFGCALPIMDTEVMDWNTDFSKVTRSSYYDVVQFIIEECDKVADCVELPWRISSPGERGRVNKAMAEAIKSRMILYAASPLYNEGEDYWDEAYNITKKVLKTLEEDLGEQKFELYSEVKDGVFKQATAHLPNDYAALYNEYFCRDFDFSSNPVDKETIFQKIPGAKLADPGYYGNLWDVDGIGAQDGYKAGTCPSQELVDAYEMASGKPILDLKKPYLDEKHTQPNYASGSGYDAKNPYVGRDPRFYASIYYNGSKRYSQWAFNEPESSVDYPAKAGPRSRTINTYVDEEYTGISETSRTRTRTGYYHRKFLHPMASNQTIIQAAGFKFFRLAELILNFAEAAAESDHLAEAWAATNRIRSRVGMPNLPEALKTDKEGLILRIRNERRIELAFEEHRYFDVRRWTDPTGPIKDLSATDKWITAMEITRDPDTGVFTYMRRPVRDAARECYTSKYLRLPVPIRDVNIIREAGGGNWQNPDW